MIKILAEDLRAALKEIERAEAGGFMHCEAVFEPVRCENGAFVFVKYSDLCEKAHPTDGNFNWGRFQGIVRENRFEHGKLVPIKAPKNREEQKCEAWIGKGSWLLWATGKDRKTHRRCGNKATLEYVSEYVAEGSPEVVWLCSGCDKKSATVVKSR